MRARPLAEAGLARLRALSGEAWLAIATVVSLGVSGWWQVADNQVPDFDSGNHMLFAFTTHAELAAGHLTAPFTDWNNYPPLGHIVAALGIFIGGLHTGSVMMADNIVFLTLLVAGCWGAARIAYGPRAGVIAGFFALGTPMVVSQMHEFYLDLSEAAMVAVSVWAILATRRFERIWVSLLAGFVCSIGMLSKQTYVLFIGGLLIVVLLRGGILRWRGVIAFVVGGAGLTLPWYLDHYSQLAGLEAGAVAAGNVGAGVNVAQGITPSRLTAENIGWYIWNLFNHQLLVPLGLIFIVGACVLLWRFARTRSSSDYTPELLFGGLVGYGGMTYLTLKDPRYTLPALVYMAVLGGGWIATATPRLRPWLTGFFGVVVVANVVAVSFGFGPTLTLTLPRAPAVSTAGARVLTFYSPNGWVRGGPVKDGDIQGMFGGLRRLGIQLIEFDGGSANSPDFNNAGLAAEAQIAGIPVPPENDLPAMTDKDAFVLRRSPVVGDPPPCQRLADGTGVYVVIGNPLVAPFQELHFVCPEFKHPYYRLNPADYPESLTHVIKGGTRRKILAVMRAMRAQGIHTVEFDATSLGGADTPYLDRIGMQTLAAIAGLTTPPAYNPAALGPRQAFMLRHVQAPGEPSPCEDFPDGSGLYIVLGNPVKPFADYRFYCPVRTPRFYGAPA
jgi:4-amino-4-deoxy-L-arabinose transferase-like glycosyltransferase